MADQKDRETWTREGARIVIQELIDAGCPHGCSSQCGPFHRRLLEVEQKLLPKIGAVPRAATPVP